MNELFSFHEELTEKEIGQFVNELSEVSLDRGQSIIPLDPIQYNMTEKLFTLHRFNGDGMTLDDVRQRSAVIHYCGRNKPWKPGYVGELDVFYNETVSQMEKDLP